MGQTVLQTLSQWTKSFFKDLDWLIQSMDVTQWAIVSVVFVVLGFMALRSRH